MSFFYWRWISRDGKIIKILLDICRKINYKHSSEQQQTKESSNVIKFIWDLKY